MFAVLTGVEQKKEAVSKRGRGGGAMKEGAVEDFEKEDEDDDDEEDDDDGDESSDDPDHLWCICQQPHNDRCGGGGCWIVGISQT